MTAAISFLHAHACAICAQAVGDRILEDLLVCESCAQALARPTSAQEPLDERRLGPPLDEVIDALLRGTRQ